MSSLPSRHSAYIGLGSNLGQSHNLLQEAWQTLGQHQAITLVALSAPYRTRPVGMETDHWFINAVGLLQTTLPPEELLDLLLATEQQFGRVRHPGLEGYQDRTMDLDLLLFEEHIMATEHLILPHPLMHERLFVLIPLAEIGAQQVHPLLHKTVLELLAEQEIISGREGIEQTSWEKKGGEH